MFKRAGLLRAEQGQSIILIAVAMIGMLAMAGLAIDGGNAYLGRRRVQNAADAGALASTRVLGQLITDCESGDAGDDAAVLQALTEYVGINGFSAADDDTVTASYVDKDDHLLGQVGAGSIPQSATGVEVQIEADQDTFFLMVLGIRTTHLSARATAMTGKVTQLGGGILPIAVPLEVVETLEPEEPFVILDDEPLVCEDANGNGRYDPAIDPCIGDPGNQNSHRGWLNLNFIYNTNFLSESDAHYRTLDRNVSNKVCGNDPNTSADDGVRGWASGECPYPFPVFAGTVNGTDGDFIHGSPGMRASSVGEVLDRYMGSTVYIPVFDYIYMSDYMEENFPEPEGIGWPRAGGGGSAFLYHIVGYAAFHINDGDNQTIAGEFQDLLVGDGLIIPGSGIGSNMCAPSMLYGINLWQ